jgi:hypothetical protein
MSDSVFNFLETTLLDLTAREEAEKDMGAALRRYGLSAAESEGILRRRRAGSTCPHVADGDYIARHNASFPVEFASSTAVEALIQRIKTVDQTFDVKPIVTITTTTTTITVPQPSPSPTPPTTTKAALARPYPPGSVRDTVEGAVAAVKASAVPNRAALLERLALAIEAASSGRPQ